MKQKLIAAALITVTTATVAWFPTFHRADAVPVVPPPVQQVPVAESAKKIDVVFVLDTTGSMGGMIETAKEKIWSIASSMASAENSPVISMGLVAYRDRGDAYVTRVTDLTTDLDSMYATLMDYQAEGGGDGPESVNRAIHDAVHRISWSEAEDAYKVLFLVGDAPPHMDYENDIPYTQSVETALKKGIRVNTIQCGGDQATERSWKRIARLGQGRYFEVGQSGGALAISTPYDDKLAALSEELDKTRLYYGDEELKARQEKKLLATEKLHAASSVESRARRAAFNSSKSGRQNLLGEGELVDDVVSGRVDISTIHSDELPAPLVGLSDKEKTAVIAAKAEQRSALQREIESLSTQRSVFLKSQAAARPEAKQSLDYQLYSTIREQAAENGLEYHEEGLDY